MEASISSSGSLRTTTSTRVVAPVLVATDGQSQSDAALEMGRLLAGSADATRLISVLPPVSVMPEAQLLMSVEVEASRRADLRRDIDQQLARTLGVTHPVEFLDGDPASVIAEMANRIDARMIVSGLGRHRVSDRLFGSETALRLMRLSSVPVFAAANGSKRLPRRVIVAVDFSETSIRAAQLAADIASPDAKLFLVHVAPRDGLLFDWRTEYMESATTALSRARARLTLPASIDVEETVLQGDPATEILALASSVNADLIAAGSHGHGMFTRVVIGSVTTRLMRCANCNVLAVPYGAAPDNTNTTQASTPDADYSGRLFH